MSTADMVDELKEAAAGLNDTNVDFFVDDIVQNVFANLAEAADAPRFIDSLAVDVAEIVLEQHSTDLARSVANGTQRLGMGIFQQLRSAHLYGPHWELDYVFDHIDRHGDVFLKRISVEEYNQRVAYYHNSIG